jgi:hypothetical protein
MAPWIDGSPLKVLKLAIISTNSSLSGHLIWFLNIIYSLHKKTLEEPNEEWICRWQIIHCIQNILFHEQACKMNMLQPHGQLKSKFFGNFEVFHPSWIIKNWEYHVVDLVFT